MCWCKSSRRSSATHITRTFRSFNALQHWSAMDIFLNHCLRRLGFGSQKRTARTHLASGKLQSSPIVEPVWLESALLVPRCRGSDPRSAASIWSKIALTGRAAWDWYFTRHSFDRDSFFSWKRLWCCSRGIALVDGHAASRVLLLSAVSTLWYNT